MNTFKLSLIPLAILITACGGGNSDDATPASASTETKTIKEAEKNLNALSKFESISLSVNTSSSSNSATSTPIETIKKIINNPLNKQKTTINKNCTDGGTLSSSISDDEKTFTASFTNCQEDTTTLNGEMTFIQSDINDFEIIYTALTVKNDEGTQYMNVNIRGSEDSNKVTTSSINGVVKHTLTSGEINNLSFSNFVSTSKDTVDESWSTIDGTINLESKCTTGTYTFQTIEKLVEAKDANDNLESGILKLNGATYTFENPQVTITAGTESETILQSELETRMSAHDACDI